MLAAGFSGAVLAGLGIAAAGWASAKISVAAVAVAAAAGLVACYGFGMAGYMTYGSRVGKLRTRDRLLHLVGDIAPWTGQEWVLDVGCGRGLMLVGAARRLTTGKAVGIDLWRAEDQAGNAPEAALENARREGVADRVSVATGDGCALPFSDATFDAVLSHWVVHNIRDGAGRARALDEMLRVLRPGGVLVIADIANHSVYRAQLAARCMGDLRVDTGGLESRIIGLLSGGSFQPEATIARKRR
jgi:SAM-dependent methyltransferase